MRLMAALSLAPRALYEEVAELLRHRIFTRELAPGSWIDELKIAEAYGISRTPLREALKVLAADYPTELRAEITRITQKQWSGRKDSNLRPSGPKPDALPGCATPRRVSTD
jgi:DNA-binding FadR family transcriptional regulator